MFGIEKIKKEITQEVSIQMTAMRAYVQEHIGDISAELDAELEQFKIEIFNLIEQKLLEFKKQMHDEYFATLDKIFQFNREMLQLSIASSLSGEQSFAQLKRELLMPVIKADRDKKQIEKEKEVAERINTLEGQLITKRDELRNRKLVLEREGKDFKSINEQLVLLDWVIDGKT